MCRSRLYTVKLILHRIVRNYVFNVLATSVHNRVNLVAQNYSRMPCNNEESDGLGKLPGGRASPQMKYYIHSFLILNNLPSVRYSFVL